MKKKILTIFALLLTSALLISGCSPTKTAGKGEIVQESPVADKEAIQGPLMVKSGYSGTVLAGSTSPYIDFNKEDYERALTDGKKILLYFYASWCPICKSEQIETFSAFNSLNDPNLVGFRVNFNDADVDAYEKQLASTFGVTYQHTKVLLNNGQVITKSLESWDKERYLSELA